MKKVLIDLLKAVEEAVPPPENCHHCITYAKYGSDVIGWEDKLALQVNDKGTFYCFFLDEDDFTSRPDKLVVIIRRILDAPIKLEYVQYGIGPGQYLSSEK